MNTSETYDSPAATSDMKDRHLVEKFLGWFRDSYRSMENWRERAIESLKFAGIDQWTDDEKKALTDEARPALVINRIHAPLHFLMGVQRRTRQEPKLLPFEGGDMRAAELMGALVHWYESRCKIPRVDSRVFADKVITGMGWWKFMLDTEDEPEGRIAIKRVHPLSVLPDPNWWDGDWADAQYVIHADWMHKMAAVEQWPDHEATIRHSYAEFDGGIGEANTGIVSGEFLGDSLARRRYFWDEKSRRVRVLEIWYKERKSVTLAINNATSEVEADPERVKMLQEAVKFLPSDQTEAISFVKRPVTRIRVAHVLDAILLDDKDSPWTYQRLPLFPSVCYFNWEHPYSLVDLMKDSQREKNRRRSTMIELVQRMPHSGFFNPRSGGADPHELEQFASGNGVVINYDSQMPSQLRPPPLPTTLIHLETLADSEVKSIVNIHDEALGAGGNKSMSGRAIEARQRGGLMSQEDIFDSFQIEKEEVVEFLIEAIKQHTAPAEALRILGTIVARTPTAPAAQMVQQAPEEELRAVLSSAFDQRYDIKISHQPQEPTVKMAIADTLTDLAQQFGPIIPPDVIIDAYAEAGILPEHIAGRIKQSIMQQQQAAASRSLGGAAVKQEQLNMQKQALAAMGQMGGGDSPLPVDGVPPSILSA